jgi:hypothetical protein
MSKFITPLVAEKSGEFWIIRQPFVYQSDVAQRVFSVPEGFLTDLASVPRVPIAYWLAGGECDEAAVIHDYAYAKGMVPRAMADAVFKEAALVSGQSAWRVQLMFLGIRLGGWKAWNDHRSRDQ